MPDLPEQWYMSLFMGGLRPEIENRVSTHEPSNKVRLITLARKIERELVSEGVIRGIRSRPAHPPATRNFSPVVPSFSPSRPSVEKNKKENEANKVGGGEKWKGVRSIGRQEMEEKKLKGLCFRCGQPYSPLHNCPDKHLRLLVWEFEEHEREEVAESDIQEIIEDAKWDEEKVEEHMEFRCMGEMRQIPWY